MCAYAETVGVAFDCRSRFRVISVCGSSLSHKWSGNDSAVPASTLRKWDLKLRMATSAAFRRWHPGGTISKSNLYFSLICCFMFSDISLSRMCFRGWIFACCRRWTRTSYARIISASFRDFMGSTNIALLSISTSTMMYLCPRFDCLGN